MNDVDIIATPRRAACILAHPLRTRILAIARVPISASDLARSLGLPRQRINYHVRQLAQADFLTPVAQQKKRNMFEQQYLASARAYVLAPEVLGEIAVDPAAVPDPASAARMVAMCAVAQTEVASVIAAAHDAGVRLRTLSLEADVHFESANQRAAFSDALTAAVNDVVTRHSSNSSTPSASGTRGRPFRLFLGCYPAVPTREP